jgi:hypothetical protein
LEVLERWFRCNVTYRETSRAINQSNAIDMGYMNAHKERGSDSKNFGTRITSFGVVVEKIWFFEVLELFLWIFSEDRDLFGIIFQMPTVNSWTVG